MSDVDSLEERDRSALSRWPAIEASNPEIVASLSHCPGRLDRFVTYYDGVVNGGLTSRRLKEVMHRRIAELHERSRRGQLPTDAGELSVDADLAAEERALVRFIDAYAVDHHDVPDEVYDDLHEHFDAAELTELLWTVAIARSMSRVAAVLSVPYGADAPAPAAGEAEL